MSIYYHHHHHQFEGGWILLSRYKTKIYKRCRCCDCDYRYRCRVESVRYLMIENVILIVMRYYLDR